MRRGVETIAAGRKERPYGTFTSYIAFDRGDEQQLAAALTRTEPDVLLDLACFQPNDIAAVARRFRGRRYVFVSTGVYPSLHGKQAREEDFTPLDGDPPEALDYLEGKRWCETVLSRQTDLPWTIVRRAQVRTARTRAGTPATSSTARARSLASSHRLWRTRWPKRWPGTGWPNHRIRDTRTARRSSRLPEATERLAIRLRRQAAW